MPGIAFGALLLAPFLDRGPRKTPIEASHSNGIYAFSSCIDYLFNLGICSTPRLGSCKKTRSNCKTAPVDKNDDGYKLMQKNTCLTCHGDNLQGCAAAPALQNLTLKPEEIAKIAKEGKGSMPKGVFKGTDEELKKLSEFVAKYNKR